MKSTAIILAAGQGTRMRSAQPKVLHQLGGKPMLWYTLQAARESTDQAPLVVIGHGAESVQEAAGEGVRFVIQEEQLGTGHAVQQAADALHGQTDLVLVLNADVPLVRGDSLNRLVQAQLQNPGPFSLLTMKADSSRGFGRIVRGRDGAVQAIVEEAQASPEQLKIREFNVGSFCFRAAWLWEALPRIPLSPKGEFYLTDLVEIAVREGGVVQAVVLEDPTEAIGINTRVHLAEAEAILRRRINTAWMESGVTLVDPATTYIEPEVVIGQDTVILPNTHLLGHTRVGEGCRLGPNSLIRDTEIGDDCVVFSSVVEEAVLEDQVDVGPYGHLRRGAHLARGAHMGNFGEVKNAYLGPGTKMGHFSYIGDATIGPEVNIGAGTITCNYDGVRKNHTEIGAGAFIGSDTMLVAPVEIGEGARTGAGAVVTKNVPPRSLAVGVPARAIRKLKEGD
jgi:bifunctional UDP-N-acetylglucosamine pyrophosphorylase/glucosamine-1-phosphate N-acetyltransferase